MKTNNIYELAAEWSAKGTGFVMTVVVETTGSSPRKAGSRMLVGSDGSLAGTVGGGSPESQVIERSRKILKNRLEPEVMEFDLHGKDSACGGTMKIFLDPRHAAHRVFVAGAGHVAESLVPLLQSVGFAVTVFDYRKERLALSAFNTAEKICTSFKDFAKEADFNKDTYILIMTPNHKYDFDVVRGSIEKPWAFLGVLGSSRKKKVLLKFLKEEEIDSALIDRIVVPVGVDIPSETPAEIAVSIVAQLIEVRGESGERRAESGERRA